MKSLEALDKKFLWHPFTQQREWASEAFGKPLVIARGRGVYLYDARGRKYLDAVSSLWANVHGHRHPALDRAVRRQLGRVAHSTFLGLTHEPGVRLARELARIAPQGLRRVFYSDNGSTAVEVALKMAYQYHAQSRPGRETPSEFLALKNSYHGDTVGSVSVGGIDLFHKKFRPLLFKTHFAMSPDCGRCPHRRIPSPDRLTSYEYRGQDPRPGNANPETGCRWQCLSEAESILKSRKGKIAAAVAEPLVQGAGGMIVASPGYLRGLARLCKRYGALLIADEVAVGFGRTGTMFACEQENVSPDFLCLSKGLTGGYLPLAATLTTEKIYRAFLGRAEQFKTFFHGHTYTANPLACAAALASLDVFRKTGLIAKTRKLGRKMGGLLKELARHPRVSEVRHAGMMAGIELAANGPERRNFPFRAQAAKRVCSRLRHAGVLMRPLGDVLVLMPPLAVRERELAELTRKIGRELDRLK